MTAGRKRKPAQPVESRAESHRDPRKKVTAIVLPSRTREGGRCEARRPVGTQW